jgi:hypothetical protein
MCTGKRRKASESSATVTIRDVFTTIAPSSATGYFILFFILVSIILLGVTLLPKTFIYETDFTDLNNLSQVDSDKGVTKILVSVAGFSLLTATNFVSSSRSTTSGVPGKDLDTWVIPCNIEPTT